MIESVSIAREKEQRAPTTVESLIANLGNEDSLVRQRARKALVLMGGRSVELLKKALSSDHGDVRWEAVKALGEIADPGAAESLARALEDERPGIRWLAAEGLIGLGRSGVKAMLKALIMDPESTLIQKGVHHGLSVLVKTRVDLREALLPVLSALGDVEPAVEVLVPAYRALSLLE